MSNEAVVCVNCGVPAGKGNTYCSNCGNAVHPEATICMSCGVALKKAVPKGVEKRDIVKAILLSIVTCGIYSIYWFIKLNDEMNAITGNEKDTSGGIAFLLTLVTCGIYSIFWAYKMGQKRDSLDKNSSSSEIIYLVLSIFGLGIVVYALMQDAINKTIDNK